MDFAVLFELLPYSFELPLHQARRNIEVVFVGKNVEKIPLEPLAGDFLVFAAVFAADVFL